MSIGERIIELRKSQGISQGQLAQFLEVSRQAVSKWENDLSTPDPLKMIRLAEVLDTDIEYLSTGRRNFERRPPIVVETTKTIETVVEKPIIKAIEKVVEIEKPIVEVQYIEKPVVKKVTRVKFIRNPIEYGLLGAVCFILGVVVGIYIL